MNVIQRVLRSWARIHPVEAPDARHLDARGWARLARGARREGVAGLVYHAITTVDRDLEIPHSVRAALRRAALEQTAVHAWEKRVLASILRTFDSADLHPILLRGQELVEEIYLGDGSLRPQVDHDILIPQDRFADAERTLESIGFERVVSGGSLFRRARSLVDLHRDPYGRCRVPSRGLILKADVIGIFSRAHPSTLSTAPLLRASPSDQLLILCAHTVKHSFDRLIRLVDIAEYWEAREWDVASLRDQALEEGSADALFYCLAAARARLGAQVPDRLLHEIAPRRRTLADRLFDGYLQGRPCPLFAEWHLLGRLHGAGARAQALREMLWPRELKSAATEEHPATRLAATATRGARIAAEAAGSMMLATLPLSGNGDPGPSASS